MDYTLCLFKPDLVKRRLVEEAILFMSKNGFKLSNVRRRRLTKNEVKLLYAESIKSPYYKDIEDYLLSGEVAFGIVSGHGVLEKFNKFVGCTDPSMAAVGTMREKFGRSILINSVHSSNANRADIEIRRLYRMSKARLKILRICQE